MKKKTKMKLMRGEEFVRRLKIIMDEQEDSRFALFLGAGCSVSSGIPSASSLVKYHWLPKLKRIHTGNEDGLDEWAEEFFSGYKREKAGQFYGPVMEALFLTPQERQKEIERLVQKKDPGFGYSVLAQLLSHQHYGRHTNVVLTTNFDDLLADALYLYTHTKPLSILHESLAAYAKVSRNRPLILKLHGDARLTPKNTSLETRELDKEFKKVLKNLLAERGLIFLGYGGTDQSVVKILNSLKPGDLPLGVYWVGQHLPSGPMERWLNRRKAFWVNHFDFDELMLLFMHEFDLEAPKDQRFEQLFATWFETYQKLIKQIDSRPPTKEQKVLIRAAKGVEKRFHNWFAVEKEAKKYKKKNPKKAREIYQKGLEQFPTSVQLLNNFAIFLWRNCRDLKEAEKHYRKLLLIDPVNPFGITSYTSFLVLEREKYDQAEKLYKRGLAHYPYDQYLLGSYGYFLQKVRKKYDQAEECYRLTLAHHPEDSYTLNRYAGFLLDIRGDQKGALSAYQKALELDPTNEEIGQNYLLCFQNQQENQKAGAKKNAPNPKGQKRKKQPKRIKK